MANAFPRTFVLHGIRKSRWTERRLAPRIALLSGLVLIPFWGVFYKLGLLIAQGSPAVYLSAIPILLALIAWGYRTPPSGVGDPESDWILAALFGGLGLFLRHLMSNRFPTLSGLWQLPLVGAVLWTACIAAVLFGVRRVMQMWALWVFAVVTVTPLPCLLITAALGGGSRAIGTVTAVLGGIAVVLAGGFATRRRRMTAGLATAGGGAAIAILAGWGGLDTAAGQLVLVLLTGAALPAGAVLWLSLWQGRPVLVPAAPPRRSLLSLAALAAGAILVFVLNAPYSALDKAPPRADPNWVTQLGLTATERFSFIQRYLGPRSTFDRFPAPGVAGAPPAAVDVITTDNLAALRTYRDAVWYPATVPPNYRAVDLGALGPGREAATDSSLATSADASDWYVLTWLWQTAANYQQVFIVVNQTWTSQSPPPAPAPLSVRATVIGPALWLARQQADPSTQADPAVTARAQQILAQVLAGARVRDG